MKANNGSGNNETRDSWETPKRLFDKLDEQYNFDVDCCATKQNTKCKNFYYDFNEATLQSMYNQTAWMNPPFSKAYDIFEHFFRVVDKGLAIYRCDNIETKIWQEIILSKADWIFIPKGRIRYDGMPGKGSRFPSALIGFGVEPPKDLIGSIFGILAYPKKSHINQKEK